MDISNFLKEDNGNESNMRLLVAFVVIAVIATWVVVSIQNKALQAMQWEQVGTVIGALIVKAWQKKAEEKGA